MTELVLGPAGSGKTAYIMNAALDALSAGKPVILLVPEQAAMQVESFLSVEAQKRAVPQTNLQILSFRRLCNRVFREYGGIAYQTITPGAKALLLWEALFGVSPYLRRYGAELENAGRFVSLLLNELAECQAYGVSASDLEKASIACREEDPKLSDKLLDLSLIFSEYRRLLENGAVDPADDLTRLEKVLSRHGFFGGTCLFIDGFVGFTPAEYRILFHALRQASETHLSFCAPSDSVSSIAFDNSKAEIRRLAALCPSPPTVTRLTERKRYNDPALSFLEAHLWDPSPERVYREKTDAIRLVRTKTPFDEAEWIASDIAARIQDEGARYRDFAVIARHINDYAGILDTALSRFHLPCHISRPIPLSEKPIFNLVIKAVSLPLRSWALEDVISYAKTGLSGLSPDEIDELEGYASRWNLFGSAWYSEDDWFMNPDGYSDRMTDEGRALLKRVNEYRKRLVAPLRAFHESLDGQRTIRQIAVALFRYLEDIGLPERISSLGSDDEIRLWNAFCDAVDIMVDILPDKKTDARLFSGLFRLVIDQSTAGTIPPALDEVMLGSADRIRTGNVKHVYLIGVNEGEFPAACAESGLFTDGDKATLETCGLILSPDTDHDSVNELFRFYTAAAAASCSVTVICSKTGTDGSELKPSIAFERIGTLFPDLSVSEYDGRPSPYQLRAAEPAFAALPGLTGTKEGFALARCLGEDPAFAPFFVGSRQPLFAEKESLSAQTARNLFGGDLLLTQSRLERFVLCRFSYEAQYVLRLKEAGAAEYGASDVGSFIHRILERFFSSVPRDTDGLIRPLSETEIDALLDEIIEEYLTDIFGPKRDNRLTPRALQLFVRLRRSTRILLTYMIEEFTESEFIPRFFEMRIEDGSDPDTVPPLRIPLSDGTAASLHGIIDRVDIYRKDGDVYVRIVDYKSSEHSIRMEDVEAGFHLQMLLYLFSIWKDPSGRFRSAVGCTGKILPAGVLYSKIKTGNQSIEPGITNAELYRQIAKSLTSARHGFLLDDDSVRTAMNPDYLPKKLIKIADFGALERKITSTVAELAEEMKTGSADCSPSKDACPFCPYREFCRNPEAKKMKEGGF